MNKVILNEKELLTMSVLCKNEIIRDTIRGLYSNEEIELFGEEEYLHYIKAFLEKGILLAYTQEAYAFSNDMTRIFSVFDYPKLRILEMEEEEDGVITKKIMTINESGYVIFFQENNEFHFIIGNRSELNEGIVDYMGLKDFENRESKDCFFIKLPIKKFEDIMEFHETKDYKILEKYSNKLGITVENLLKMVDALFLENDYKYYVIENNKKRQELFKIVYSQNGYYLFSEEGFIKKTTVLHHNFEELIKYLELI